MSRGERWANVQIVAAAVAAVATIVAGLRELHRVPEWSGPALILGGLALFAVVAHPYFQTHRADLPRAAMSVAIWILAVALARLSRAELAIGDEERAVFSALGAAAAAWLGLAGFSIVIGGIAERRGHDGWIVRFSRRHRPVSANVGEPRGRSRSAP